MLTGSLTKIVTTTNIIAMRTYLQNLVLMNQNLKQNQQFRKHLVKKFQNCDYNETLNHPFEVTLKLNDIKMPEYKTLFVVHNIYKGPSPYFSNN